MDVLAGLGKPEMTKSDCSDSVELSGRATQNPFRSPEMKGLDCSDLLVVDD